MPLRDPTPDELRELNGTAPSNMTGPTGPTAPMMQQYRVAGQSALGPIVPPVNETIKMGSDMLLGTAGMGVGSLFPPPLSTATIPLGSAGGQAISDRIWGTPTGQSVFNAAVAGGVPLAGMGLARAGGALAGIPKGSITDTIQMAVRHPIDTIAGLRITRPGVGLGRGAQTALADSLDTQLADEMAKPTLPVSVAQRATTEGILNQYRGLATIDGNKLAQLIRNALGKPAAYTTDVSSAQALANYTADNVEKLAQHGPLDIADVEGILDQVRASTDFTKETAESTLKNTLYEKISGIADDTIRAEIKDPALRTIYDDTKAAMKTRLDARDALRKEIGRLVMEGGEGDFYKGMQSFLDRVNKPTPAGAVADKVLRQYDATHDTNWYWEAKRLNLARQWSPDDRVAARTLWNIWRAELSLVGVPLFSKMATEATIASPVATPLVRDYIGRQINKYYPGEFSNGNQP